MIISHDIFYNKLYQSILPEHCVKHKWKYICMCYISNGNFIKFPVSILKLREISVFIDGRTIGNVALPNWQIKIKYVSKYNDKPILGSYIKFI